MPSIEKYCMQCGTELTPKYLKSEGKDIPFCPSCNEFRFPVFSTAVSMIVMNPAKDKILLIKQYGGKHYILTAGYINKGEDAEDAAAREILEETGLHAVSVSFNHSHYYAPSNTLMLNFTAVCDSEDLHPNAEIDSYQWFTPEEARANIRPDSLAQAFLNGYLDQHWEFPDRLRPPYSHTEH